MSSSDADVDYAFYELVATRLQAKQALSCVFLMLSALFLTWRCSRLLCALLMGGPLGERTPAMDLCVSEPPASPPCSTFLDVTQIAFDACATNFTTSVLAPAERKCIANVSRKYIASALRVSARFAELQETAAAAGAADAAAKRAFAEAQVSSLQAEVAALR